MSYQLRDVLRTSGLLVLLHLVAPYATLAQQLPGTLLGSVQDSVSRQPVAYATVVLLPLSSTGGQLAGATTDPRWLVHLAHVGAGFVSAASELCRLCFPHAVCRGYVSDYYPSPNSASAGGPATGRAVVVGRKPLVEVQPDRLVYHAAQDIGNAGGTAADVLRKTPLLAVDGTGTVTMRGSTNFKVLVNNHSSLPWRKT
ncbi:MAG: hypothetical protein WKG07_06965 [Hymenobacter sp.]